MTGRIPQALTITSTTKIVASVICSGINVPAHHVSMSSGTIPMPNKNYLAGVRFEREIKKMWETKGWKCIRASGSHGEYDLICYTSMQKPLMIQCKVVTTPAEQSLLLKRFDPTPQPYYHQQLSVKVKGTNNPKEVTI